MSKDSKNDAHVAKINLIGVFATAIFGCLGVAIVAYFGFLANRSEPLISPEEENDIVAEETSSNLETKIEPSTTGTLPPLSPTITPVPTAVPTASPEPPIEPIEFSRSCQEILETGQSIGDGYYTIDADGHSGRLEPFEVYCDMTRQGGGWTLYAYHTDGIAVFEVSNVTKSEPGVMSSEQWKAVRINMTIGMMFVDELGKETTISATKLNRANCQNVQNPESLMPPDSAGAGSQIWHYEDAGCGATGQDYSLILLKGPPYGNYKTGGASLYQWSAEKFDIWPYRANASPGEQNELFYFIK